MKEENFLPAHRPPEPGLQFSPTSINEPRRTAAPPQSGQGGEAECRL